MASKEYWTKRAERTLMENEKSVLQYERDLKKAYEVSISNIQKEVEAFYTRYAKDNEMDLATARQRLNVGELLNFKKQSKIYLDEVNKLGLDPLYKQYLKELSGKAYISKLQEFETNIRHEIETLSTAATNSLTDRLKDGYEDSFYKTMFDIQKQASFGVSFTTPGKKQLETAVKAKWLGDNYSGRVWKNKTALLTQLNQIIPQEFVMGKGPGAVARDLANKLDVSYSSAVRLARTEMNHISNEATMNAYKESGVVEEYEYLSTLDSRTSEICRELDGKVFKLSQKMVGVNYPPMHPYCRSTTVPYFADDEFSEPSQRIARDKEGKTYFVDGNTTYKDWVEKHAEASYAKRVVKQPKQYKRMDETVKQTEQPTPATLKDFAKHTEEWEKNEVLAKVSEQDVDKMNEVLTQLINNNDFAMRIKPASLKAVLDEGSFKNQMEVGDSQGTYDPDERKRASKNLFGNKEKLANAEYEKYGYLGPKDKENDLAGNPAKQYGRIIVTFDKNKLMDTTTFTLGDSLAPALGSYSKVVAGSVKNPRANGITSTYLSTFKNRIDSGYITSRMLNDPIEFAGRQGESYVELQFHGQLTTKQIASIVMSERIAGRSPELIQKIKDLGISLEIFKD